MTKTRLFFIFLVFHCALLTGYAQPFKPVRNEAFTFGEKLKFRAYYDSYVTGQVTAGIATLEVDASSKLADGRKVYHVVGEGHSKGAFNWFYKVNDRFESFIDEVYLFSWMFMRRTHEGSYNYNDDIRFNQYSGSALSTRANKRIIPGTQDILSAFYFARTLDLSAATPGQNIPVNFYLDDSLYISQIQFAGREVVITDLGTFRCLRFKPMVATGNVFSQPYPMDVWVTDDKNHLPILAQSVVIVGTVKLELLSY